MSFFSRNTATEAIEKDADFVYTHRALPGSSLVDVIYYAEEAKELAVSLNGYTYVYDGVPKSEYDNLVYASSVGRYYQIIKREYGPGKHFGYTDDLVFKKVASEQPTATPKALTYAEDAVVTDNTKTEKFDLTTAAEVHKNRHEVVFTVYGNERTYNVDAASVDEAVNSLSEALLALGLSAEVKRVTVYFD